MADTRRTSKKTSSTGNSVPPHGRTPPAKTLSDTAQQIWLAGVGAFARAQAESNKMFEGLVKEGLTLEKSALRFAGSQAETVRGAVETGMESARERATQTLGQLEIAVESGVRRALDRIGVPDGDEIAELRRRMDTLSAQVRKQGKTADAAPSRPVAKKRAAKKPAAKRSVAPVKAATAAKSAKAVKTAKSVKSAKATKTARIAKKATPVRKSAGKSNKGTRK